eukprot:3886123-Amphidinium_carterae.3
MTYMVLESLDATRYKRFQQISHATLPAARYGLLEKTAYNFSCKHTSVSTAISTTQARQLFERGHYVLTTYFISVESTNTSLDIQDEHHYQEHTW